MTDAPRDTYRLPTTVVPSRYELRLTPHIDAAAFDGECSIDVEVTEPVTEIVLNAAELAIESVTLSRGDLITRVEDQPDLERVVLHTLEPLEPGPATIRFRYRGVLNDKLRGFYRSTYRDADGNERVIATTQLQSTDARRAFPCFDEPEFKATFAVTLVVPEDLLAVSNGAEVSSTPLGDGTREVVFAETMKMSTYLVAFVVGPLEATDVVDAGGVPVRVITPVGQLGLSDFALELTRFCLPFFASYYDIPYPGDKVDLLAIPDFAAGAMENLGCITFRDTALLVDPATSTQAEQQRVADVVAHELAHMWFGDLVTMRWWNGIWLNEAFATFMEMMAVDAFRPAWQRWVGEAASERSTVWSTRPRGDLGRGTAFDMDATASTRPIEIDVHRPEEAEGMFDALTYHKGAALLRMLEQYLGEDRFRDGIRRYLRTHAYGNTETHDLWDALEAETGEPVRSMMDAWIFQGGHPQVTIGRGEAASQLVLSHRTFRVDGSDGGPSGRPVPVVVRVWTADGPSDHRLLLEEERAVLDVGAPISAALGNAGGHGFYRVRYEDDLGEALAERLGELTALERFGVVSDTWAAVVAGQALVGDVLAVADRLVGEEDPSVLTEIISALGELWLVADDQSRPALAERVRSILRPSLDALGWSPSADDSDRRRAARGRVLAALGVLGEDPEVTAWAQEMVAGGGTTDDAEVRAAATTVAPRVGDAATFDLFFERYRAAPTPQQEERYLMTLSAFADPDLIARTLPLTLDGTVRTQNAPFVLNNMLANPQASPAAWAFITNQWDQLVDRFPSNTIVRMVDNAPRLTAEPEASSVDEFLVPDRIPQATQVVAQLRDRHRALRGLRARAATELPAALE